MVGTFETERERDTGLWDKLVERYKCTPFLSRPFIEPMAIDGAEPIHLTFKVNGEIVGFISGVMEHSGVMVLRKLKRFRAMTFYSGPFVKDPNIMDEALKALIRYARSMSITKFVIMGYDQPNPILEPGPGFRILPLDQFILDLRSEWDKIERGIHRGIRRKLKKADSYGIRFTTSTDPGMVDVLYDLMEKTGESRNERGYGDFKMDYIPHLVRGVLKEQIKRGIARIGYVEKGGTVLSIQLYYHLNGKAYALFMGTSKEGYDIGANALVFRETAKALKREGYSRYNFGGTPKVGREGIVQFKTGLGAVNSPAFGIISPVLLSGFEGKIFDINRTIKTSIAKKGMASTAQVVDSMEKRRSESEADAKEAMD